MLKRGRCTAKRGFTLTEVAIVLAIVGIVVAGIFTAASATFYRIRLNQGVDEISQIAANMRSLYAGQNASAAVPVLNPVLINEGVFPKEMLVAVGGVQVANHPWDTSRGTGSAQITINNPAPGKEQFVLTYFNLPADVCADILVKNSLPGPETGLIGIDVNGVAFGALPVTPIAAATACPTGALYAISWHYTLGS